MNRLKQLLDNVYSSLKYTDRCKVISSGPINGFSSAHIYGVIHIPECYLFLTYFNINPSTILEIHTADNLSHTEKYTFRKFMLN